MYERNSTQRKAASDEQSPQAAANLGQLPRIPFWHLVNLASLFSLTAPDLIIILMIVLLLFGAKKLPKFARGLGEAIRQFREARRQWMGSEAKPEDKESLVILLNRLLVPIAIIIFLLACGIWVFGQSN
jgi:TatA/E family protein of Tat protein translocase